MFVITPECKVMEIYMKDMNSCLHETYGCNIIVFYVLLKV